MATPPNAVLIARLIHTGLYADGRPNTASVLIPDGDWGLSQSHRKTPLYVPAGGFIDVSLTSDTLYSLSSGSIAGFVLAGVLRVELIMRLRDPADLGGAGGTGISLSAVVLPNITRIGNALKFVIDATDAAGFIVEENLTVAGLSGAYSALNGTYEITAVTKGADLAGANPLSWVIDVASVGAPILAAALVGVTLTLPQGKVRYEVRGSGNAGGLGADATVYVGGDMNVTGLVDPTALQLTPILPGDAPNGSLFVDSTTGLLYFKDADGNLTDLESGGGGGGGGGSEFTYRPGGAPVPSANVYDTWAACYAAAASWPSLATIVIDSSIVSPAPIPAGTWNMSGILLAGSMEAPGIPFTEAECQDGAVFTNLLYLTHLLRLSSVSSSPVIVVSDFMFLLVDFGCSLTRMGSAPMFEVGPAGNLNIIMLRGAQLSGGAAPLISVLPDGFVGIQLYEVCQVDSNILEGSSASSPQYWVSNPAASFSDWNPAWLGAPINVSLSAAADRVGFDQAGSYGLPNDVEGAINELAIRTGIPAFVYRPGGSVGGAYYDDFTNLYNVISSIPGPKDLVFDDTFAPINLSLGFQMDMTEVTWHGRSSIAGPATNTTVTISNNTSFLRPAGFRNHLRLVSTNITTSAFLYGMGFTSTVLGENSSLESTNVAAVDLLGSECLITLQDGARLISSTAAAIMIEASATVTILLGEGAVVEMDTLAGTLGPPVLLLIRQMAPSASFNPFQPSLLAPPTFEYGFPLGGLTTITAVQGADYAASFFDTVRVDTSAILPFNVNLPDATTVPGGFLEVKDITGGITPVTIVPFGVQTIDGGPSLVIGGAVPFARLRSDGTDWVVVNGEGGGGPPAAHASTHEAGGSDEILVENFATGVLTAGYVLEADGAGGLVFNPLTVGVTKDANATSENIWADRANQTPTIGAFAGQVNLGSESVAAKGTEGNYAAVLSGQDNLATGDFAAICSGQGNLATGVYAFVGGGTLNNCGVQYAGILAGYNNSISVNSQGGGILCGQNNVIDSTGAQNAILGGDGNNVTGGTQYASILGGEANTVQGDHSIGGGSNCNLNHADTFLYAGIGATVDSQETSQVHFGVTNGLRISNTVEENGYVLKVVEAQTTDATVTTLWSLTVSDLSAMYIKIRVTAVETDGSNRAAYDKAVLVYRSGGGAVIQGAVQDLVTIESDATWDCTFDVDANDVRLRITGEATSTINWRGTVSFQQAS